MTDALCAACGRPVADQAYLCQRDADWLARDLGDVPALEVELEVTVTRQDRIGDRSGGGARRAVEPLPYSPVAAEAGWVLANTLTTWARHVAEERGAPAPHGQPAASVAARWLLGHVEWLRHRPEAAEALDEIRAAIAGVRIVIDARAPRWYAGPCGAEDEETGQVCPVDLYALPGASAVRCPSCGAEYDADARQEWLLAAADDALAHAELIGRAAAALGVHITPADVRYYAASGQVVAHGCNAAGNPVYRFGEVVAVARHIAARKAARRLIAAGQEARRAARVSERDKSA